MSGTEGIVDEQISHGSQFLAQLGIVLGLALHVPGVLQQHDLTVLQSGGLGLGVVTHHVFCHDDFLTQQLAEPLGNHLQAQLGLPFALGLAMWEHRMTLALWETRY